MNNRHLKMIFFSCVYFGLTSCSGSLKLSKSQQQWNETDRTWGKVVKIDKIVWDRNKIFTYAGMGAFYKDLDYKQGDKKKKVDVVKFTPRQQIIVNGITLAPNKMVYGVRRIDGAENDFLLLPEYDNYFIPNLQNFYARKVGEKYYKKINLVSGEQEETKIVSIYKAFEDLQQKISYAFTVNENNEVTFFKDGIEKNKISNVDFTPLKQGIDVQSITPVKFMNEKTPITRFFVRHFENKKYFYQMYDEEGNKIGQEYSQDEIRVLYHRPIIGMDAKDYYHFLVKLDSSQDIYWPISASGITEIPEKCLGLMPLKEDYDYFNKSEFNNRLASFKWAKTAILWEDENDKYFWSLHAITSYNTNFSKITYPPLEHRWIDFEPIVYIRHNRVGYSNQLSKGVSYIVTSPDEKTYAIYTPGLKFESKNKGQEKFKSVAEAKKHIAENNKSSQASYDKAHAAYVKWSNSTVDPNEVPYGMKEVVDKKGKKKLVRLSMDELIKKMGRGGDTNNSNANTSSSSGTKKKSYSGPTGALRDQSYSRLRNSQFKTQSLKRETQRLRSRR